jgi:hypothetical protein
MVSLRMCVEKCTNDDRWRVLNLVEAMDIREQFLCEVNADGLKSGVKLHTASRRRCKNFTALQSSDNSMHELGIKGACSSFLSQNMLFHGIISAFRTQLRALDVHFPSWS